MEAVLLALCLSGGYFFSVVFRPSIHHASRESGHRLYFRAIYYSFFLAVIASEIYLIGYFRGCPITLAPENDLEGYKLIHHVLSAEHAKYVISILIFLIGVILPYILNLIFKIPKLSLWLLKRSVENNEFELMLLEAQIRSTPILFTLSNNKIYVGWVISTRNPKTEEAFLRFLPLLSGYREEPTHQVKFTTNYISVYERMAGDEKSDADHLTPSMFEVVVPIEQIVYMHAYDLAAQNEFNIDEKTAIDPVDDGASALHSEVPEKSKIGS